MSMTLKEKIQKINWYDFLNKLRDILLNFLGDSESLEKRVKELEEHPGGGVPEAPENGNIYGRQDGDWVEVTGGEDTNALHKTGNENFTGIKSSTNSANNQSNGLDLINSSTSFASQVLNITNTNGGRGVYVLNSGTEDGAGIQLLNTSTNNLSKAIGIGLQGNGYGLNVTSFSGSTGNLLELTSLSDSSGDIINMQINGSGKGIDINNLSFSNTPSISVSTATSVNGLVMESKNGTTTTYSLDKTGKIVTSNTITALPAVLDTELVTKGQMDTAIAEIPGGIIPIGTNRQVIGFDGSGNAIATTIGWKQLSDLPTPPPFSNGVYVGTAFQPDGSALFAFVELDTNNDATGTSIPIYTSGGTLTVQDPVSDLDAVNKQWFEANSSLQDLQSVLENGKYANIEGNTIDIFTLDGDKRMFNILITDEEETSELYVAAGDFSLEVIGISNNTTFSVVNGSFRLKEANGSFQTSLNFKAQTANVDLFLPSKSTSGEYIIATTDDIPEAVDTAFWDIESAGITIVQYNNLTPNFNLNNIVVDIDFTLTDTSNGDFGMINLYFGAFERTVTMNGFTPFIVKGTNEMIPVYYIHDSDGLKWYYGDKQVGDIDTSDLAKNQGTVLWHSKAAESTGSFTNIGNICTGTGMNLNSFQAVGAKITKANNETAIIATVTDDNTFTTVEPFETNGSSGTYVLNLISYRVNDDGSQSMYDWYEGAERFGIMPDGTVHANGMNAGSNSNVSVSGVLAVGDTFLGSDFFKPNLPIYATEAAAIADTDLESGMTFKVTGDLNIKYKP